MDDKQQAFQDRISRIRYGATIVSDNVHTPERRVIVPMTRGQELRENARYPLSIVGAFLLGMLAVFIGRYVSFQLIGTGRMADDPSGTFYIDIALAAGVAFVIRMALDFRDPAHLAGKSMGITVAAATMHNLVHAAPSIWAILFSEEWVAAVIQVTEPKSIYFAGISWLL